MKNKKQVEERIAELREGMANLPKTPDVMTKAEMVQYYTSNFAIAELADVLSNQKPYKKRNCSTAMEQLQPLIKTL